MDNPELLKSLDKLKATMIAVSTGGPRIGEVQGDFTQTFDQVTAELKSRGIENPLPYRELFDWYGRWSSGDLPTYQSRRSFVNAIFAPLTSG